MRQLNHNQYHLNNIGALGVIPQILLNSWDAILY